MSARKLVKQAFAKCKNNTFNSCCDTKQNNCDEVDTLETDLLAQLDTLKQNLINAPIVHLNNSNFVDGTYRIRTAGTYIIDEDIEFNPTGTDGQPPGVGWFAIIGVETDNVIIDIGGHELRQSTAFLNSHIANVFAEIELDNSPFAGNAQGVGFAVAGSTYPGETKFVTAHNVWIKNGTLGQSGHWGIHGNNNSGIFLDNLRIYDWEVAGITLNGLTDSFFTDLDISGNQHLIPVRALPLNIALIQGGLASFGTTGPIGEQAVIINNNLTTYLDDNKDIFTPLAFPDGSVYGILIAGGSPFSEPFPLTPVDCANAIADTNGARGQNILSKNINIHDVTAAPLETIALGSKIGGFLSLLGLGIFGMIRWDDLFDADGNFGPDALGIANAFVALQNLNANPDQASSFPSNLVLILSSIVNNDATTFFDNAVPVFGRNFMSSVLTGVFGFRVDCSESNVIFDNCNTNSVINIAGPSITLDQISGASHYPNLVPEDNSGSDVWGFEFSSGSNVTIQKSSARNTRSENGDSFGFDMISSDTNFSLSNCVVDFVYGLADGLDAPSEAYGYRFKDTLNVVSTEQKCPFSGKVGKCPSQKKSKCKSSNSVNSITNSKASNIISKRASFGFSNESTSRTNISDSCTNHVVANSSVDLQSLQGSKFAYGFSSESGDSNVFDSCVAVDTAILGENEFVAPTTSVAAGFALLGTDANAIIQDCTSKAGNPGAGVYAGIYIGANVTNPQIDGFTDQCSIVDSVYGQVHEVLEV